MVKVKKVERALLFIFILSSYFLSHELTFLVAILGVATSVIGRGFQKPLLKLLRIPFYIIILGSFYAWQNSELDIVKDYYYFLQPIIILGFGYVLAYYIRFNDFVRLLIISSAILAAYYIMLFLLNGSFSSMPQFKRQYGVASYAIILALSLLLICRKFNIRLFSKWLNYLFVILFVAATIITISRTFLIFIIIMLIAGYGVLQPNKFFTLKIMTLGLLLLAVYVALFAVESNNRYSFLGKLQASAEEVTIANYASQEDINANWRGFESYLGWNQIKKGKIPQWIVGQGFGQSVPIGFEMTLGGSQLTSLPKFHNGFITILLKTGVLGIILYCIFFMRIIISSLKSYNTTIPETINSRLTAGLAIVIFSTTLVISGWLNGAGLMSSILALGYLINNRNFLNDTSKGLVKK